MADINYADIDCYYPKDMQDALNHILNKYRNIYMSPEAIKEIAEKIREYVRFLQPFIEDYIRIEDDNIYIAGTFADDSKGTILFLPLIFQDIKYDHLYNIYICDARFGSIEYKYRRDHHAIATQIVILSDSKSKKKELQRIIQIKQVTIETT